MSEPFYRKAPPLARNDSMPPKPVDQAENLQFAAKIPGWRPPSWVIFRPNPFRIRQLQGKTRQNRFRNRQIRDDSRLQRDHPRQKRSIFRQSQDERHLPKDHRLQPRIRPALQIARVTPTQGWRPEFRSNPRQKPANPVFPRLKPEKPSAKSHRSRLTSCGGG